MLIYVPANFFAYLLCSTWKYCMETTEYFRQHILFSQSSYTRLLKMTGLSLLLYGAIFPLENC